MYDVFISFKKTDERGNTTPDFEIAKKLYKELSSAGLKVFFSEYSLESMGSSQYQKDIGDAILSSKAMVVVLTNPEYAKASWVKHEWMNFHAEFLNERRSEVNLFTFCKNVNPGELPLELRNVQSYNIKDGYSGIVNALLAATKTNYTPYKPKKPKKNKKVLAWLISILAILLVFSASFSIVYNALDRLFDDSLSNRISDFSTTEPLNEITAEAVAPSFDVTTEATTTAATTAATTVSTTATTTAATTVATTEATTVATTAATTAATTEATTEATTVATTTPTTEAPIAVTSAPAEEIFEEGPDIDAADSRNEATKIKFNNQYTVHLAESSEDMEPFADWFAITTSNTPSAYRIEFAPQDTLSSYTHIYLFDSMGRKIQEFTANYTYENYFFDFTLENGKNYFIKVFNEKNCYGNYSFTVHERPLDAGTSKEEALKLELGTEYAFCADTTLHDWFTYTIEKDGKYSLELFNIDVGANIYGSFYYSKYSEHNINVKNEDSDIYEVNLYKGDVVYIKIKGYDENANGTYFMLLKKL